MTTEPQGTKAPGGSVWPVLRNRNFRLLWLGQTTSGLGDYFHMIAAPWLVLRLTNDPLALGAVLALGGIPRAVLMLVGGAITDRYSPRSVMLASDLIRLALTAILAALTLTGTISLPLIYVFSLAFGIVSAFFWPAAGAVLPTLVGPERLQPANALSQATNQLLGLFGPALAGTLIAGLGSSGVTGTPSLVGIGLAFVVDALTFVASVATLWLMVVPPIARGLSAAGNVLASIGAGLRFVWNDRLLRLLFTGITAMNFFLGGPIAVGIPVMANARLAEGAVAFGIILSAYGGGNLLGLLLAGVVRPKRGLAWVLMGVISSFGLGLVVMGFLSNTWIAAVLMAIMGFGNGYISIIFISFLQRRTPQDMLGRMMSLLLLANVGLGPVSQALAGAVSKVSIEALFGVAGACVLAIGLWMGLQPALRLMDRELAQAMSENPPPAETSRPGDRF
jgi:MFS family permease